MDVSTQRMLKDMRQVVAQTQALLDAGGDRLGKTRETVAAHLQTARDSLLDLEHDLHRGARRTIRHVNRYAEDNPWQVAGVGLAVGLVLGTVLGLAAAQRRD